MSARINPSLATLAQKCFSVEKHNCRTRICEVGVKWTLYFYILYSLLQRVVPLLCNDRRRNMRCLVTADKHVNIIRAITRQPLLTTIEGLLEAVFSVGSAPRL
jgi:hypothetical protein